MLFYISDLNIHRLWCVQGLGTNPWWILRNDCVSQNMEKKYVEPQLVWLGGLSASL